MEKMPIQRQKVGPWTQEQVDEMLKRLKDLPPPAPRITSLAKLIEVSYDAITELRLKGYSWADIAQILEQESEFKALPNTVRDSYSRVTRKRKAKKKRKRSS
ncbi:MAG: hypothetical protein HC795_17745 [Coleofasciculaceae cyanobacterium RL_1_1]|nr:hypothetical protein [Coleofasciculaceae cyanobacterium RL_1_1]